MYYTLVYTNGKIFSKYKINEKGTIKNKSTNKKIKHKLDKDNYHRVGIYDDLGIYCNILVHRAVYITFGEYDLEETGNQVNHVDGNKDHNFWNNLEPVTCKENINHAIRYNLRDSKGTNSNLNKYNENIINDICTMLELGIKHKDISEKLGIPMTNISDIRKGRTWSHISKLYNIPKYEFRRILPEEITKIKEFITQGYSNTEISDFFEGIDHKQISAIRCGKRH